MKPQRTPTFAPRPALLAVVAALAVGVPATQADTATASGAASRAHVAAAGCSNADALPGQVSGRAIRAGTLCLLNAERGARGMRKLRTSKRLAKAATSHAADMTRRHYFAHDSLSGQTFGARIRHTGYMGGAHRWVVGENLAWGSGRKGAPRQIVDAWMHSPEHRANILQRRFRQIGVGVVGGAPEGGSRSAATYATDFGARR